MLSLPTWIVPGETQRLPAGAAAGAFQQGLQSALATLSTIAELQQREKELAIRQQQLNLQAQQLQQEALLRSAELQLRAAAQRAEQQLAAHELAIKQMQALGTLQRLQAELELNRQKIQSLADYRRALQEIRQSQLDIAREKLQTQTSEDIAKQLSQKVIAEAPRIASIIYAQRKQQGEAPSLLTAYNAVLDAVRQLEQRYGTSLTVPMTELERMAKLIYSVDEQQTTPTKGRIYEAIREQLRRSVMGEQNLQTNLPSASWTTGQPSVSGNILPAPPPGIEEFPFSFE